MLKVIENNPSMAINTKDGGLYTLIPKGAFLMGDDKKQVQMDHDYWMAVHPVTNAQYQQYRQDTGNHPEWVTIGGPNNPAVNVSANDARKYCEWNGTRLPSSKEWEKAARGTDGRKYPWGDEFDVTRCNTSESKIGATTPVTHYPSGASPYGCMDMSGNVWELTVNK